MIRTLLTRPPAPSLPVTTTNGGVMSPIHKAILCASIAAICTIAGCRSTSQPAARPPESPVAGAPSERQSPTDQPSAAVTQVAYQPEAIPPGQQTPPDEPFAGSMELSLSQLVAEVEARNPSLQAMIDAWHAAAQRYPQVVSLEDPMFMAMAAPASFDSNQVEAAYALQVSQKIPWYGKRAARGRGARAAADAAAMDAEDSRLQLDDAARQAYFDYYLVRRDLELNQENLRVMQQNRATAKSRYDNNQGMLQDVLQSDVELADLERQRLVYQRMNRVAMARINTLLLRPADAPLAPPPRQLALPIAIPSADQLRQIALERRPDLAALGARIREEEAGLTLACKQYYPDTEFYGRYDTFWQPASTQSDLRAQVGVNVNLPIYANRLSAAVCEARYKVSQRRAEFEQRKIDIQYEVQSACEQLEESRQTLALYHDKLIPAVEQNMAEARSNYEVNKLSFLNLAQAQRQWIEMREKQQAVLATYHRHMAELERIVASPLGEGELH
jgi:outer membrane protein, heavy metal efflux system